MKIEMHYHTKETSPCGQVPAANGIQLYKDAGYDAVVITDHFCDGALGGRERNWDDVVNDYLEGYRVALKQGQKIGVKIALGLELRFPKSPNDFLVYGVTEEFLRDNPFSYLLSMTEFRELADRYGLIIVQAHPYRAYCYPEEPWFLDGIEVCNGNPRHNSNNDQALQYAVENGLFQTIGSDFHQEEDVQDYSMDGDEFARMFVDKPDFKLYNYFK